MNTRFIPTAIAVMAIVLLLSTGCTSPVVQTDPFYDNFYSQARLIMLDEEVEIYEHLPDFESKKQFIIDFWKKRDPNPGSAYNEFKREFENRIAYANRWFREGRGANRGWDTERGRILLVLGFPSNREWGNFVSPEYFRPRLGEYPRAVERWVYEDYQMEVIFVDMRGHGSFDLDLYTTSGAQITSSMEIAKSRNIQSESKGTKLRIKFDLAWKDNQLVILIPIKSIVFEKEGDMMRGRLKVAVTPYFNYKKMERQVHSLQIDEKEEAILTWKEWKATIPMDISEKGRWVFEVVVTDEKGGSSYLKYLSKSL